MDTLQNKCIEQLLITKDHDDPLFTRMLERMVNFNDLTDDVLTKLYYQFNGSNETILNRIPERIKQQILERERYERWLDNMTVGGAAEFDSSFDSEYDPEDRYDSEPEPEPPYNELLDWCEALDMGVEYALESDCHESVKHYDKCYENIVYYSNLTA